MCPLPGAVAQSSPETAKRHAEGVGLDGDAQRQATVFRHERRSEATLSERSSTEF